MGKLETPKDKASLSKIQIKINFGTMDFAPRAYAERLKEAHQSKPTAGAKRAISLSETRKTINDRFSQV